MSKDAKIEEAVTRVRNAADAFLRYIECMGNQCAYTDRMVEEIIENGKNLENVYNNN